MYRGLGRKLGDGIQSFTITALGGKYYYTYRTAFNVPLSLPSCLLFIRCLISQHCSLTLIQGLGFGFYCSWKLSLIIIGVVPFMALTAGLVMKLNQSKTARATESYAKAGSVVYSAVSSIRTILSLNAVDNIIIKFNEATEEAYSGVVSQVIYLGGEFQLL